MNITVKCHEVSIPFEGARLIYFMRSQFLVACYERMLLTQLSVPKHNSQSIKFFMISVGALKFNQDQFATL